MPASTRWPGRAVAQDVRVADAVLQADRSCLARSRARARRRGSAPTSCRRGSRSPSPAPAASVASVGVHRPLAAAQLADREPALELAHHARPADEHDVRAARREPAADPAADRARSKDDDAWHVRTVLPEARALQKPKVI